jgi:EmrB/QacA subfamily drug resistance transporter
MSTAKTTPKEARGADEGSAAAAERRAEPWILAATIIASGMVFIDGTVVNIALPVLQRGLHTDVAGVQWVVEAYTLLLAALLLPGGALGDRFGRRRILALGIVIFALASTACGLAANIGQLIAARAVQGVGGALLVPGSLAIITASFGPERRGRAIGTWSGFSSITTAGGPVLGGWLVEHFTWRAVFFINLPLAAIVVFILYWRVRESRSAAVTGRVDWPGTALVAFGLGLLVYGLVESSNLGLANPIVIGTGVAGVLLLAAFVLVEAHSPAPIMPLQLFRSRTFSGTNLLTLLLYGALSGMLFFFPFDLIQVQGYSATAAGAALLPFSLLLFLLSRWSGGLVDRLGARLPLIVGPAVVALSMVLFTLPGIGGSYWVTFFPLVVLLGLGMAITVAPLTTAVMSAAGTEYAGSASGINNAVSRVAGLLAIAIFGIFMLNTFSGALDARLAALHPPPAVAEALNAQRTQLAAEPVPADLDPAMQAALRGAVNEAFVAGFRVVMLIGAGMAAASALSAWALVKGKKKIAGSR